MPLSAADTARLYSDAFASNMKLQIAENGFALCDLKTQLDVSKMAAGVLQDELDAAQKELADLKAEIAKGAQAPADGDPPA
jgi:glycerate-2-kinase